MPLADNEWSEHTWRKKILDCQLCVKAEAIKRLAQKLEHGGDFPTDTPKKLSQLIKHTAGLIGQYLPATPSDQLRNVNWLLCEMAAHLRYVERSRVANTPWSMIHGAEEFLRRQAGTSSHFIIRPQWGYNYQLISEFVEVYRINFRGLTWIPFADWEASIGSLATEKIYCLSFPRIERLNCLLHASWGHEVGHIIAAEWIENRFDQVWGPEEAQIQATMEHEIQQEFLQNPQLNQVDAAFANYFIQEVAADRVNEAMEVAKQGLTELICDAIGVHLLGPAALAAAIEFSAPLSIDANPLTCDMYPPWRYRIRLMVKECEEDLKPHTIKLDSDEVNYPGPIIEPFYNWLRESIDLVQNRGDIQSIRATITTREAYRVIEANWEMIRNEALQYLPAASAAPYRLFEHIRSVEDLVRRLQQDTPPNEIGKWPNTSPACLEDILNAAWAFKLQKTSTDPSWGSPDDFEKLFRLVLKGMEVSFVHSTFGPELKKLEQQ